MKKVLFALAAFFVLAAWTTNSKQILNGGTKFTFDLLGTTCDPNASGTATLVLNQGQGTISYQLTTSNTSSTVFAAHIHDDLSSDLITLNAPVNGISQGVVNLSKEKIKEIRQNPEEYYVNIHTRVINSVGCPGGALKGYLSK